MGRILVIDDEPSTRMLFRSRLEDLGHEVSLAANGAEGLLAARSKDFDLFLVDIGLGSGVDGFEVCRRLKTVPQTHSVPVVLISGQSTTREDLHKGYNAGCESFLMKGNMTLLEDVMRAMLRIKSLKDDIAVQNYLLERQNRRLQEEMQRRGPGEGEPKEDRRGPERSAGLLLVGHDGLVQYADRGARDLFGAGVEGRQLGMLAPSRGLEAYVRDARIEDRSGFRLDLTARAGRVARSLLVSVVPTMPRGASNLGGLKAVVFHDLHPSAQEAHVASSVMGNDPSLLEAARRCYRPSRILGSSLSTTRRREQIERAARSTSPVLFMGPEGSGKTFSARVLHFSSDIGGTLVRFDAQSVSNDRVHSSLFGATGVIQQVGQGTLVICNGECLDKQSQLDLIALIERGELPGGVKADRRLRLVMTTSQNLDQLNSDRHLLAEFLALFGPHGIEVSPLEERIKDIEPLARDMAREISGAAVQVSNADIQALESYEWPGNVRELEDTIEVLVAAALGDTSAIGSLPEPLRERGQLAGTESDELQPVPRVASQRSPEMDALDNPVSLDGYERLAIERALRESEGDKLAAARLLNVGKSTLYRKLKRHGIA
jgi:DNA-binding NtrC family response regulator